jgi:hypothetical protein
MGKHAQSIDSKVISRIQDKGQGWVFTPADFLDVGTRDGVDKALARHVTAGTIRQLARGLYDYPRKDKRLGILLPSTDDVAKALQGKDGSRLQATGAQAANALGLSDQVSVKTVYLTDGRGRKVQIGKRQIVLKHTTPRNMATAGRISGTVIQALRWLGQRHVDDKVVANLRRKLPDADKRQLFADVRFAPEWIAQIIRKIVKPPGV